MLDSIFTNANGIDMYMIALSTLISLVLGMIIAKVYMYENTYSRNFVFTIALLPALTQSVIMVVNGNLGAGVAVMGAFGLVRFRSVPGNAKEIIFIFFAMAAGLSAGMGYVVYATLFTAVLSVVMLLLGKIRFGEPSSLTKILKIVIPEDLDYTYLFDDLFADYTDSFVLNQVRTTNLGGLYELQYTIKLKKIEIEKEFLDLIRQRNGNLNLTCSVLVTNKNEL